MKKILIPIDASKTEPPVANEYDRPQIRISAWLLTDYGLLRYDFYREEWASNTNELYLNKDITWYKEVTIDELLPSKKEIKKFVEYTLIPEGYKTIHIGSPLEVANIQFLERKRIDKFVNELTNYIKQKLVQ